MPGAAMLEAGRAAAQHLVEDGGSVDTPAALCGASIPAPLILPSSSQNAALPDVQCTLSTDGSPNPTVIVQGRSASGPPNTHLSAEVYRCLPAQPMEANVVAHYGTACIRSVLHRASACPPVQAATCGGMLLERQAAPGYYCHPTALDATLHLAAVDSLEIQSTTSSARVPVGAAAFLAPAQGRCSGTCWPTMACESTSSSATVASYTLCGSGTGGSAFHLEQLQSKALRQASDITGLAATPTPAQTATYQQTWLATQPVKQSAEVPAATAAAALSLSSQGTLVQLLRRSSTRTSANVFDASQRALWCVQRQPVDSLHLAAVTETGALHTPVGCLASQLAGVVAAAAVHGLLKAAVLEGPGSSTLPSTTTADSQAPGGRLVPPAAMDVYAAANARHGVWLLASLRQAVQEQQTPTSSWGLVAGTITITGGMGALGLTVAGWAAVALPSARLQLSGRSASGHIPSSLASAMFVSTVQSDAAVAADMHSAAFGDRNTAVYVHAGELQYQ